MELVVINNLTLDGVMQAPGPSRRRHPRRRYRVRSAG
jgi:hypothetical protein